MALDQLIEHVTIETALLPAIELDHPLAPGGGAPNPLLMLLKPKITVHTPGQTYTSAPYGDPGQTHWPAIRNIALLVIVITAGTIAWKALK